MRKLFAVVAITMALIDLPVVYDDPDFCVSCDMVGPYQTYASDVEIDFSYYYRGDDLERLYERINVYNALTGAPCYSKQYAIHNLKPGKQWTFQFPLKLKNYFGQDGLRFKLQIQNDYKAYFNLEFELYPQVLGKTYYVTRDEISRVTSNKVGFSLKNSVVSYLQDDFNFVGFKDYIDAEKYYQLYLGNSKFLYNMENLPYDSAYLKFFDNDEAFKYLHHGADNLISIPLILNSSFSQFYFDYKNKFYVDRRTLQISTSKVNGFFETKYFFLPVNQKQKLLGKEMTLEVNGTGYSKCNLIFEVTYDAFRGIIGNCNENDYCVIGEVE